MELTLAALLHDIGKFYQRTGYKLDDKDFYKQFETWKGSYRHASYTAQFIDKFFKEGFQSFLAESAAHHVTNESIIKKSDHIASGHDRKPNPSGEVLEQDELELNHQQTSTHFTKRLLSIFNEVNLTGEKNKPLYVPLSKFNEYCTIDTIPTLDKNKGQDEYRKLFDEMINDINKINYSTYEELHHLIYPIIKKYTTTIPANTFTEDFSTVSLFDHMKLTTAITNCLNRSNHEIPFVLVEYDISGIQSFIYRITEGTQTKSNIAKALRTRSFYLNILSDFVAYSIINYFGLTYENVLYSSGGRGLILVQNTTDFKSKMEIINSKIEKSVYDLHNGDISFSIAYNEITPQDLQKSKFKDLMDVDSKKLISKKSQKFLSLLKSPNFSYVSKNVENLCLTCETNDARGKNTCLLCDSLLHLNDDIIARKNSFIIEFDYRDASQTTADFTIAIGNLGTINIYLSEQVKINKNCYYQSVNSSSIGEIKFYARSNVRGLSFGEIAKESEGDPKLAVIKMDVDNLGYIFSKGIKQDTQTSSKILTLSRMMDYFFTKVIVDICSHPDYKNSIYINYSGGDDLVIISPASMSLNLVEHINREFSKYTGNNSSFHLSSGIEILHPSSPIRFAIERAERQLINAKSSIGKQSVGILDQVIQNSELKNVLSQINEFTKAIKEGEVSRTGLYNIYLSILNSLEKEDSNNAFYRYIPQLAYSIKRNVKGVWFDKLKSIFIRKDIDVSTLQLYKVILGYTLMKTREEKNNG